MGNTATISDVQRMALPRANSWSEETRTVEVVLSTDADVGDGVILPHANEAIEFPNRPLPAVLDHRRDAEAVWGVVESLKLEDAGGVKSLVGVVRVDGAAEAMALAEPRLRNGSARFSIGARVLAWDASSMSEEMYRASRWTPVELSLVVVGQDRAAIQRSSDVPTVRKPPMTDELNTAGGDPASVIAPDVTRVADPSPQPQPATVPAADGGEELVRSVAALRRESEINRICRFGKVDAADVDRYLASSMTPAEVSSDLIRRLAEAQAATAQAGHPARVEVVREEAGDMLRGFNDALTHRIGLSKTPTDLGRRYHGRSVVELMRMLLDSKGVNTDGMGRSEVVDRAFHSTSDFPLLFADVANKSLMGAYAEEPQTWRPLARQRNLPDFKTANELQIAGQVLPTELKEGGEYQIGTVTEGRGQWSLATYARKVMVTRRAIINDDLSALSRLPEIVGRGCRTLESNLVWALITTGANGANVAIDGTAMFVAGHNNTGSGAIGVGAVAAGRTAMRKQTDIAGNSLNLAPQYLVVPSDLETAAEQFLAVGGVVPVANVGDAGPNPFRGSLQMIVENRLSTDSTAQWYLASDPGRIEMIRFGYLDGAEGPQITTTDRRDPDGLEMLVRMDFGCTALDFRGFYRSTGV